MKHFYFAFIFFMLFSCSGSNQKPSMGVKPALKIKPDFEVALHFINEYTEYCNKISDINQDTDWIEKNQCLTRDFKKAYKQLIDSARQVEPEVGLEYDPIFNAQDYPDKGFEIKKADEKAGDVIVQGVEWKSFTIRMRLVYQCEKWMVDGAGSVNMKMRHKDSCHRK